MAVLINIHGSSEKEIIVNGSPRRVDLEFCGLSAKPLILIRFKKALSQLTTMLSTLICRKIYSLSQFCLGQASSENPFELLIRLLVVYYISILSYKTCFAVCILTVNYD